MITDPILGILTVGQSPRDDVMPHIRPYLPPDTSVVEAGALDGLDDAEIQAMAPMDGDYVLTSRLRDGRPVRVGRERIMGLMQARIRWLEAQGANPILILCTGEFPEFTSRALLIEPDRLLTAVVRGLGVRRLAVFVPLEEQVDEIVEKWRDIDPRPDVAVATPYGPIEAIEEGARTLRETTADVLVLDCMGYTEAHRQIVARHVPRPVLLASATVARVVGALL